MVLGVNSRSGEAKMVVLNVVTLAHLVLNRFEKEVKGW